MNANLADILESDIEEFFKSNPDSLGLGPIEIQESQLRQDRGILDLLAYQSDTNTYFEIEIMRRQADEWHITHVLDYWANERKKKPYSNHIAVLITESCRGRYNNLLLTLASTMPLIVIELDILQKEGSDEYLVQCKPIYYPDAVKLNKHKTIIPQKTTSDILTSNTSMLLIAYILEQPDIVKTPFREICSKVNISLGAVGNIFRALEARGFIKVNDKNRELEKAEDLLEHFNHIVEVFPDRKVFIEENSDFKTEQFRKNT